MFFITIEQVKYFLALNKYKSFSLASEELCISQSSLSKQIKAFENELNILLFNRTTRSISLILFIYKIFILIYYILMASFSIQRNKSFIPSENK